MDDDSDDLSRLSINLSLPADSNDNMDTNSPSNHNLLLNNIHKIEGTKLFIVFYTKQNCELVFALFNISQSLKHLDLFFSFVKKNHHSFDFVVVRGIFYLLVFVV